MGCRGEVVVVASPRSNFPFWYTVIFWQYLRLGEWVVQCNPKL